MVMIVTSSHDMVMDTTIVTWMCKHIMAIHRTVMFLVIKK